MLVPYGSMGHGKGGTSGARFPRICRFQSPGSRPRLTPNLYMARAPVTQKGSPSMARWHGQGMGREGRGERRVTPGFIVAVCDMVVGGP